MLMIAVPGERELRLEHLVLDANGTLTDRGALTDGVADAVRALRAQMRVHVPPLTRSARLNASPSSIALADAQNAYNQAITSYPV